MAAPEVSPLLEDGPFPKPSEHTKHGVHMTYNPQRSESIHRSFHDKPVGHAVDTAQSWVPLALRRRSLVAFMVVYIILIIALAILFNYSNHHNGLVSSRANLHYLWTYGPTAVFTIVAALWMKVDYHTKQLAPWRRLAAGPASAERTVLLDYISNWNVKVLVFSIKAKHFDVFLVIAATLLLQLVIIFSTGLFALEARTMSLDHVPISTLFEFANPSANINSLPFMTALAIKQHNLDYPAGTTETFAYQTFNVSRLDLPFNATINATVDALSFDLDCQPIKANWTVDPYLGRIYGPGLYYSMTLNSTDPDCPPSYEAMGYTEQHIAGYFAADMVNPCNINDTLAGSRWWLFVAHIELDDRDHEMISNSNDNSTIPYRTGPSSVNIVACQPRMEVRKAVVVSNGLSTNATLLPNKGSATFNFSAWDILAYVKRTEAAAWSIVGGNVVLPLPDTHNVTFTEPTFELMNTTMTEYTGKAWMDTGNLIAHSRKAFQGAAAQVAAASFVKQSSDTIYGSTSWTEQRLVLRLLSFWLVTSLLIVLFGIAATLVFYRPFNVVTRDPGTIAGLAAILASSPDFSDALQGVGHSAGATKARLKAMSPFHTETVSNTKGYGFHILSSRLESIQEEESRPLNLEKVSRWRPFHMTLHGRVAILIAPLAGIATLEALYQRSQRRDGIADISPDHYTRYAWVFLPAFIVWLIGAGFESIYFYSTVVQMYQVLRKTPSTAAEALTDNLTSKILIHNAGSALRRRRWAVFFAAFTVFLGAILPIVVAGLYTIETITTNTATAFTQKDSFNASMNFYSDQWSASSVRPYLEGGLTGTPHNANPMASLILYNNLSYPAGTYEEFAFTNFTLPDKFQNLINEDYDSVTIELPAVRGRSNCTIVPQEHIRTLAVPDDAVNTTSAALSINTTMAPGCWGASGYFVRDPQGAPALGMPSASYGDYYVGGFAGAELTLFNLNTDFGFASTYDQIVDGRNMTNSDIQYHGDLVIPPECPRGMITFAKASWRNTTSIQNTTTVHNSTTDEYTTTTGNYTATAEVDTFGQVTAMHCWPYVEHVVLNTTFSMPSLAFVSANPLPPNPNLQGGYPKFSEAEIVQNSGLPEINNRPNPWGPYFPNIRDVTDPTPYLFDKFMDAVMFGKGGSDPTDFLGLANAERLAARVDKVYGTIMAQLYNSQARIAAAPDTPLLNGTAFNSNQYRVVQNLVSTRILEAVLAAMFVSAAFTFFLLDTKYLLPQNPCSVGAAASFLAGSQLVDRSMMPVGSEFMSDKQVLKGGQLAGLKFAMGWWERGGSKRFGIDVVDPSEEQRLVESSNPLTAKASSARTADPDSSSSML